MSPREAFDAIRGKLERMDGVTIVRSEFNEEVFGEFFLGYRHSDRSGSILCDRCLLYVCDDDGGISCKLVVEWLIDLDEDALFEAIRSAGDPLFLAS